MKPDRTTVHVAYRALQLGAWCVVQEAPTGLSVAHRSGIAVAFNLRPMQAVRLLRALQAAPACPVQDAQLAEWAYTASHPDSLDHPVFAWIRAVGAIVERVTGTTACADSG